MEPNKEKELRNHLKTLDKDQLIELLLQFKWDAELLQGLANDTLDVMNEKLVLEKALELSCETIEAIMPKEPMYICGDYFAKKYNIPNTPTIKDYDYFIQQARESLKNDN